MKKENRSDLTLGEMKEFFVGVGQSIPTDLSPELIRHYNGHKKELAAKIREALLSINSGADTLADWQKFYNDIGYPCGDLSGVRIPENPNDANRAIVMAKGITPQVAYDLCYEHFNKKCWKWTDENLDKIVISERTAQNGPYAIRIRDRVEADVELKNLSYNQLKSQNIIGITLEERLIFELKYFKETGKHLDIQNITLCSGSLYRDGSVPSVCWYGDYGVLVVNGCGPGNADDFLRARVAVTLVT